ncbi:MAG TPA: ADP-forming succinate--CoA ligase subunit beta [Solirubrobacteraceae bacterium]|nr:ADP-forming succinate--CoA ligase subunit beta [Solirubrobacteraceae bacterium]
MDLLEYQGKQLFAKHGLEVSPGRAVRTVQDALDAANEIGYPVVIKAQVLIGGRGKAGGVKLADDEAQAREHAENILGMDIRGHTVRTLWIEHASDIASEYYASVLLDRQAKQPLVIFSVEGGVEIEQVALQSPEKLIRRHVDALKGLSRREAIEIATEGGADEDVIEGVADALVALYEVWSKEDALLTEINPLIVTPGTAGEAGARKVKALDAKVSLDDNALYRHPENQGLSDGENEDPIERRAKEQGVQYVALDGDIGILGNGAGLVMSTLDVVAQAGGRPANFLDAGGGSDAGKIKQAVELILSNDAVKAVLFNIFGGITRCDEVARGLIAAFAEIEAGAEGIPFVVRLDGTNDVQGRELLGEAKLGNVYAAKTMNEAAEKVVALAAGRGVEDAPAPTGAEAGRSPAVNGRPSPDQDDRYAGLDAPRG